MPENIFEDTKPCIKCGKQTTIVDIFPGGLCPPCYMAKMDSIPLGQIPKPDFRKALRTKRKAH